MIIDTVKQMLAKQLRIDAQTIKDDAGLADELGADSIDLVEMLLIIEEKLGIFVTDEEALSLKTVRDVADYIEAHS